MVFGDELFVDQSGNGLRLNGGLLLGKAHGLKFLDEEIGVEKQGGLSGRLLG